MRKFVFAMALIVTGFILPDALAQAETVEGIPVKVRLYTDRAEVTRAVTAPVQQGPVKFSIGPLPEGILQGSTRLSRVGGVPVQIGNVKTGKIYGGDYLSDAISRQQTVVDDLQNQTNRVSDREAGLNQQLEFLGLLVKAETDLARSGLSGKNAASGPEQWDATLDYVSKRGEKFRLELRKANDEKSRLETRLKDAQKKLQELQRGIGKTSRYVQVEGSAPTSGDVKMELTYQTRNTRWSPVYQLQADTKNKKLTLEYIGEIYQQTGEDWKDVRLELSTGRPALGTAAPKLPPWVVDFRRPPDTLHKGMQMDAPVQSMIKEKLQGLASPSIALESPAEVAQKGTSLVYTIAEKQTIPSGSRDHRAIIVKKNLDLLLKYRTVPKRSPLVFLDSEAVNESRYQLLPGRAWNFVDGAFAGVSRLTGAAPGQKLKQGLGSDSAIRVERKLIKKEGGEEGLFDKRKKTRFVYEIEVENFKNAPVDIEVKDQLPLSWQEEISLTVNALDPQPKTRDKQNILTWNVSLQPGEKTVIKMDFQVEYPAGKKLSGL